MVAKEPRHIKLFMQTTETVGKLFTVNKTVAELRQLVNMFVPVTVKVEETVGLTIIELEIAAVLHEYVDAPEAERIAELPMQIALFELTTLTETVKTLEVAIWFISHRESARLYIEISSIIPLKAFQYVALDLPTLID